MMRHVVNSDTDLAGSFYDGTEILVHVKLECDVLIDG